MEITYVIKVILEDFATHVIITVNGGAKFMQDQVKVNVNYVLIQA